MKGFLRIISVVLSIALLLTCTVTVAYATGGETACVSVKTAKSTYACKDSFDVTLNVSTNYNSIAMRWFVLYSKNVFELVGDDGNFTVTEDFSAVGGNSSYNFTGNVTYPEGYSSSDYSIAVIQWVGGGENLAVYNNPSSLDCFKFTLKVKEGVSEGTQGKIFIPSNSSYYDAALADATNASTYYKATNLSCTFVDASVTVKEHIAPQLKKVDGSDTVIDETDSLVYGFTGGLFSESDFKKYIYAIGDDTEYEIVPTQFGYGTGTKINLVQEGKIVKTYTVIFFGDGNGDSVFDESDIILMGLINAYLLFPEDEDPMNIALDVQKDTVVDESDMIIAYLVNAFLGEINQTNAEYVQF